MENERINLLDAVRRETETVGSRFRCTIQGRDALLEFLDVNGWFGIEHGGTGGDAWIASLEPMKQPLDLWLRAYKRSREEKINLMLDAYRPALPRTCRLFEEFVESNGCKGKDTTWKLLDFLLAKLDKEIDTYDAAGIRELTEAANQEFSRTGMRQMADFLCAANGELWSYRFQTRQLVKPENGAYTQEQFSVMAYTVFNEEAWNAHGLIQKASEKRKYAELWLFTALHFVGALRKPDIAGLPVPSLPYPPQELRRRIAQGLFTRREARAVSEELLFRMDMTSRKPRKTARGSDLKLNIPENILEPFGIILALSLSWRENGDPFVRTKMALSDIHEFFGEEFARAAGNKRFLSLRASKAYLQGIETAADQNGGASTKGYMLAALARSHKGGIGRLPEMTDVYLRDANFSGYTPEFILREMFERGIFGFIPALLLEKYKGEAFRKLGVSGQTRLIKAVGLDALQLESVTAALTRSFQRSVEIVQSLLQQQRGDRSALAAVLQNIASGAAPSRQSELLCLRSAAGFSCCAPDRSGCLGCCYEIYTKSAMHLFMKEYVRMNREKAQAGPFLRMRLENILEKGILPAVAEMLDSIPALYPDADMELLYSMVERGIQNADGTGN